MCRIARLFLLILAFTSISSRPLFMIPAAAGTTTNAPSFVNFETPVVHPIALSPSGKMLAVCNLPNGRVDVFRSDSVGLTKTGSVPVGIDPVSVRFRNDTEVWVVNYISGSINIIDPTQLRVIAILQTQPRPTDVIFGGAPEKAFVAASLPNLIQVFDPVSQLLATNISVQAERPTALAISPDRLRVYATIKESGNHTTILARNLAPLHEFSKPGPVDDVSGPYEGANPPPNAGKAFSPLFNPALGTNQPPLTSMIVRKMPDGTWRDGNQRDWSDYVSGPKAGSSGRMPGWDMLDHDIATVDANTFEVSYIDGLMTICLDLAVNPANGMIAMIGTESRNELRFEPNLNGIFSKAVLALVQLDRSPSLLDLNPHLDYLTRSISIPERHKSIGDPRSIVWSADGTRCYVAGRGSDNMLVLDVNGLRTHEPVHLDAGPAGLALDESHKRIFVFSRFDLSISWLDLDNLNVVGKVRLFDPTPEAIRRGRVSFYNTQETSGLGHVSCATCHVDARMDRLAWDLGNPAGEMQPLPTNLTIIAGGPARPHSFHPLKGAMITPTLQDIIGHEPFHWRGDKAGIEEFNATYMNLQSADNLLTASAMADLKAFFSSIYFPPNPYGLMAPTNLPLVGYRSPIPPDSKAQLPNGNAYKGSSTGGCATCHRPPAGLGQDTASGAGEANHSVEAFLLESSDGLVFKNAQFRNLYERSGLRYDSTNSTAGFGFLHDGRADRLERFIFEGADTFAGVTNATQVANILAALVVAGSQDLTDPASRITSTRGAAPAAGQQIPLTSANTSDRLTDALQMIRPSVLRPNGPEVELVVRGVLDGLPRSWWWDQANLRFQSDREREVLTTNELRNLVSTNSSFVLNIVHRGTGRRLALDQDEDGYFDRDELDAQSDPADAKSVPQHLVLRIRRESADPSNGLTILEWDQIATLTYTLEYKTNVSEPFWELWETSGQTNRARIPTFQDRRFFRLTAEPKPNW